MNRNRTNKDILDRFFAKNKKNEEESKEEQKEVGKFSYAIIRNIPKELHSKDLRKYFKRFIEAEKFQCFHYRHRPELQAESTSKESAESKTCCCLISLNTPEDREEFIGEFHKRNWQNSSGVEIPRRCFVDRLKIHGSAGEKSISVDDLKEMIELKPPAVMPNGNIGTPSQYFLEQIRMCRLPASVIAKLGIETQKRAKKFGEVPFSYEIDRNLEPGTSKSSKSAQKTIKEPEKEEKEDPTERIRRNQNPGDNDSDGDNDDDQCEEWERHEALHEDVTEQDRIKPKKYEEEMEVTWEKGGPGLVWYTDKNYWDEQEKGTDCDWAWADDWDVDYSVYYEGKSAGDMDARAAVEMRNDELQRAGKLEQSVFTKRKPPGKPSNRKRRNSDSTAVASDTLHKGIGGTMLSKMGWRPGMGLGKKEQGKIVPVAVYVEEDGQSSREKTGFGYRGEKMSRIVRKKPIRHVIASVFDKATDSSLDTDQSTEKETATGEVLFRSAELTKMKYRD
ncbi:hypothetical protein CRE_19716 [Caenorhabditis remanei]|uniref:G-patch domain-containing protein n=1 Tax=Caenorhabditis remanei TaxID=31234 RepID=E3MDA3_CAERE|nr:hypothetical protein CRE_19716 [Caenorhabditis remanei]